MRPQRMLTQEEIIASIERIINGAPDRRTLEERKADLGRRIAAFEASRA